ncbi:hypothetical protein BH09PLA1_BH09PLA1_33670 [soil metagenome]
MHRTAANDRTVETLVQSIAAPKRRRQRDALNRATTHIESLEIRRLLSTTPVLVDKTVQFSPAPTAPVAQPMVGPQRSGKTGATPQVDRGPIIDYGGIANPLGYQIGARWSSTASGGTGTTGSGITLTYSIVPDGLIVGQNGVGEPLSGSSFRARMDAIYGNMATWLPVVQSVFESWSAISGITYVYEPNDDGAAWLTNGQLGVRGDVRISAHPIDGGFNVLAYNFFPNTADMVIDSNDLQAGGFMFSPANNSRALRNVMAHEHGHGLGFNHVDPTNNTKLMEAFAATNFDGPQYDDMLAVQRNYGDFYEKSGGNNTFGTATNRGTLSNGADIVQKLATSTTVDQDWFRFDIGSSRNVTVDVTPVGPTYLQGSQGGATSSFNGMAQANLQVALFASDGTTQLAIANATGTGFSETINGLNLPAGTYFIRVNDQAGSLNNVQSYTLTTTVAPAQASAVIVAVSPDPRTTTVSSIAINFNEAVNGFDLSDLSLVRDGFTESLAGAVLNTANNINYTLSGLDTITNRVGAYTLTLNAAGSGITTQAGGNPIVNNAVESWLMTAHVGTAANETIRIAPNGALTNVFVNNVTATPTYSFTTAAIPLLTVDGGAGDDVMVVDFSSGSPLPVNGLNWIGGADVNGDTLRVIGEFSTDTFQFSATALTRSSPLSPTVNVSGNEIFDLQKGAYTAFTDINSGLIASASTTVTLSANQHMRLTTVNTGALVRLSSSGSRVLVTGALSITGTGRLDIFNNALIVDYTGGTPISSVESMVSSARAGGPWTGNGLISSNARVQDPKNTGLGVIEATDYKTVYGPGAAFFGQSIDTSAVLVMYTYYGDTDFNGVVNFDDYSRTDTGFGLGNSGWFNGDFDLNGTVNFDDYSLIDLAFNTQEGL